MANQVIVKPTIIDGEHRWTVQWETAHGTFFYGYRETAREAYCLAKWISRYYAKARRHDSNPGPAAPPRQIFSNPNPKIVWV